MNKQVSAVIVHGSATQPTDCTVRNWFPWLKGELIARGVPAVIPQFPILDKQSVTSWLEVFSREIGEVTEKTILFGHSTGVAFLLNLLNQSSKRALGTFLVGGFVGEIGSPVFDPLNESFFKAQFDWEAIRRNAGELSIYSGDNDPFVPLAKGIELAAYLTAELIVIPNGGHLNQDAGFTSFPRLLRDVERLLQ